MTRLVETFDSVMLGEARLEEHPGHSPQSVHAGDRGSDVGSEGGFSKGAVPVGRSSREHRRALMQRLGNRPPPSAEDIMALDPGDLVRVTTALKPTRVHARTVKGTVQDRADDGSWLAVRQFSGAVRVPVYDMIRVDLLPLHEAVLMEHPGHGSQKVHGRRYGGIASTTIKQGGFSADWVGHKPRSGYMVGGVVTPKHLAEEYGHYTNADGSATILTRRRLAADIKSFVAEHREALKKPGHYLGTWVDDDGTIWLDVSQRVATKGTANRIAASRGEKAVYDVRKGTSFDTEVPDEGGLT